MSMLDTEVNVYAYLIDDIHQLYLQNMPELITRQVILHKKNDREKQTFVHYMDEKSQDNQMLPLSVMNMKI